MKLRKLNECDAEGMLEWMNDPKIQYWFRFQGKQKNREDIIEFIRNAEIQPADGKSIHYAIADDADEYLGTVSLKNMNLSDHNAEYAISLRTKAQGNGIGRLATELLLKKAFEEFSLERVYLNVLADNAKAIRMYKKAGFVYEGESRNSIFLRGEYQTLKWYSMLKSEYFEKFLGGGSKCKFIIYRHPSCIYTVVKMCAGEAA